MFGALLRIGEQFFGQRLVLFRRRTALARAGNGTHRDGVTFEPRKNFRRSADHMKIVKVEIEHVRRRIEGTQCPVERERRRAQRFHHALRRHHLHDVALEDVFFCALHCRVIGLAAKARHRRRRLCHGGRWNDHGLSQLLQ